MSGRWLIEALTRREDALWLPSAPPPQRTSLHRAPRRADAHPLRACACDVDLRVFGHTQCAEARVPWPEDRQAHPHAVTAATVRVYTHTSTT